MVYAAPFLRLVVIGKLYQLEDFSFSMSLINAAGGAAPPTPSEVPPAIVTAVQTLFSSVRMSSQAKCTMIKLNLIGTDGRYVGDDTVFHEFVPPVGSGANTGVAPQLSYVVGLETAATRGRASRGRFYLPLPADAVDPANGTLSTATQTSWKASVDPFLSAVNGAMAGWTLGVTSNIGAGTQRGVTNARYGRVLDTMRSRRDKFAESYIAGASL